jgi:hypothetical protein
MIVIGLSLPFIREHNLNEENRSEVPEKDLQAIFYYSIIKIGIILPFDGIFLTYESSQVGKIVVLSGSGLPLVLCYPNSQYE